MKRMHFRAPSPALVISIIALFAALGGTSYAALAAGSVGTKQLKNKAVTNSKLAANSVGTAKIRGLAVTSAQLGNASVLTGKIANNAVTNGQLADNAVTTSKIVDRAVETGKLADNSVTSGKLAPGAVTASRLASATQVVSGPVTIGPNGGNFAVAVCPVGTRVLSGGGATSSFGVFGVESFQSGNGWLWAAFNSTAANQTISATAVCLAQ
jgi:hypothetical protein